MQIRVFMLCCVQILPLGGFTVYVRNLKRPLLARGKHLFNRLRLVGTEEMTTEEINERRRF
jgi:hypothetical protein